MAMPWVEPFRLIQNTGRGLLIQGNRDWRDIVVSADVTCHLGCLRWRSGSRTGYAPLLCANTASLG